jgi:hypothetical protein
VQHPRARVWHHEGKSSTTSPKRCTIIINAHIINTKLTSSKGTTSMVRGFLLTGDPSSHICNIQAHLFNVQGPGDVGTCPRVSQIIKGPNTLHQGPNILCTMHNVMNIIVTTSFKGPCQGCIMIKQGSHNQINQTLQDTIIIRIIQSRPLLNTRAT